MEKRRTTKASKKRPFSDLKWLGTRVGTFIEQPELAKCSAAYQVLLKKLKLIAPDVRRAFEKERNQSGADELTRTLAAIHEAGYKKLVEARKKRLSQKEIKQVREKIRQTTRKEIHQAIHESPALIQRALNPIGKSPDHQELIELLYELPKRYGVNSMRALLQDVLDHAGITGLGRSAYMLRSKGIKRRAEIREEKRDPMFKQLWEALPRKTKSKRKPRGKRKAKSKGK